MPEWATYLQQITERPLGLTPGESTGAVLLLKPDPRQKGGYAVTWGLGRFLLNSEKVQADLGLRTALNLLGARRGGEKGWDPERLRSIRTKRVGQTTLISQTQASRKASIDVFPFSVYADQLRQVTGTPVDVDLWGSTVTGGDSLQVRRPERAGELIELCKRVERVYRSKEYKEQYGWIDNVTPVYDQQLIERALTELIKRLRARKTGAMALAPPAIVNWEGTSSFEYQSGRQTAVTEEPSVETFLEFVDENELLDDLSVSDIVTKLKLHSLDDAGDRNASWPLVKCFTAELELSGKSYILDEGSLFLVDSTYLGRLNDFTGGIPVLALELPMTEAGENEGPYNERLAAALRGGVLLDKKTVTRQQATPVEICDVATMNRKLIHVKKGFASAALSHLFAQGVVSAELLHMDDDFRKGVKKIISGSGKSALTRFSWLYESPFQAARSEVSYVVMTGKETAVKPIELPFFSKVNLRLRCDDLRRMGFRYSLALVPRAE